MTVSNDVSTASQTFTLTVNSPPTFSSSPIAFTCVQGRTKTDNFPAISDPCGSGSVSYSTTPLPMYVTITGTSSLSIEMRPLGTDALGTFSFDITLSSVLGTSTTPVSITVVANQPPYFDSSTLF